MRKEWEKLTDEALIEQIHQTGNPKEALTATDVLMDRYKEVVRCKARTFFLIGADREDVVQEGMIGLYKAVMNYQPEKAVSFRTFAELCITRQIMTAVRLSSRKKHWPLNHYVSLDQPVNDEDGKEMMMIDILPDVDGRTPEEILTGEEELYRLQQNVAEHLSPLEKNVLQLFVEGLNYIEIAEKLNKSPKSIDNALQRVKMKIRAAL